MTDDNLYDICLSELSKYDKRLKGLMIHIEWNSDRNCYRLVVCYCYRDNRNIPYAEDLPAFWLNMDEKFVRNNFQTLLRYLIKTSLSVEINNLFGWEGGFNPL